MGDDAPFKCDTPEIALVFGGRLQMSASTKMAASTGSGPRSAASKRKIEFEDDCGFVFRRKAPKAVPIETKISASQKKVTPAAQKEAPSSKKNVQAGKKAAESAKNKSGKKIAEEKIVVPATSVATSVPEGSFTATPSKRQLLERQRRRSSLSNLGLGGGRRRSSVGVGFTHDLPPVTVDPAQYHRHILPDIPGPLKMKQLLVWAVQKAAAQMRSAEEGAGRPEWEEGLAEGLVQGLHTNGLCVSWYQRPATGQAVSFRPNPVNVDMRECLGLYQRYCRQLQTELSGWKAHEGAPAPTWPVDVSEAAVSLPTPSNGELGAVCKWLHRLPFHVDRLGWLLHVYGSFEGRSRQYCEDVFRQIFERFFSSGSTPGSNGLTAAGSIAMLKALSSAQP